MDSEPLVGVPPSGPAPGPRARRRALRPLAGGLGFAALLGSCVFFAVTSGFYIDNRTNLELSVSWTTAEEETRTALVPALSRLKIAEATLIETNEVRPSQALRSLSISLLGEAAARYGQNPVEDGDWLRAAAASGEDAAFVLVVTTALLGL